jgi:hypothetical protein
MVSAEELGRVCRTLNRDEYGEYQRTNELIVRLAKLRPDRRPFFLTEAELEQIFKWKLIGQYGRGKNLRRKNAANDYIERTRACFAAREEDKDKEAALQLKHLLELRGVGVPIASAILALVDPANHCVIDFRGWRAVFGELRRSFGITHYLAYRRKVSALAMKLGWTVQETDLVIWILDKRRCVTASCTSPQAGRNRPYRGSSAESGRQYTRDGRTEECPLYSHSICEDDGGSKMISGRDLVSARGN